MATDVSKQGVCYQSATGDALAHFAPFVERIAIQLARGNGDAAHAIIDEALAISAESITPESPIAELSLDQLIINALEMRGVERVRDLLAMTVMELRAIPNFGVGRVSHIDAVLGKAGLVRDECRLMGRV